MTGGVGEDIADVGHSSMPGVGQSLVARWYLIEDERSCRTLKAANKTDKAVSTRRRRSIQGATCFKAKSRR
jgi:hypothetical protein